MPKKLVKPLVPAGDPEKAADPPPPVKAYKNEVFLNSDAARPVRVLAELLEPNERLKKEGIENFLVFFGSARTLPTDEVTRRIDRLEKKKRKSKADKDELVKLKRLKKGARFYDDAVRLAEELTVWSKNLMDPEHRFYICSGGGPGMMEAANRGASQAGGRSIGLGISLPFEQHNNAYISHSLNFEFHYFFVRKYWFLYLAKALIVFPGGFGTMDELFEMLTLIQTQKTKKKIPIVLYGTEFWKSLMNWDVFIEWGAISPDDMDLIHFSDSVEEARDFIIDQVTRHYIDQDDCGLRAP
jgi:hypothetical protein